MPIYAYKCAKCKNYFELLQSFVDEPIEKCPKCGGKVRKQLNAPGIVFKGQGFYKTDSREVKSTDKKKEKSQDSAGPKDKDKKDKKNN